MRVVFIAHFFSSPRIRVVAVFVERFHRVYTSVVHVLLDTISRVFLQRGKSSLGVGIQFRIDRKYSRVPSSLPSSYFCKKKKQNKIELGIARECRKIGMPNKY